MAKETEQPGTEITPVDAPGPMVMAITGKGPIPEQDTEEAHRRIREAIIGARSAEELIEAGKALSTEDVLGVPIEVHEMVLLPSQFEGEGLDVFAVLDCVRGDTGDQFVLTTSAENVVLRCAVAKDRGWLPLRFKIGKASKETARGFTPYIVEAI